MDGAGFSSWVVGSPTYSPQCPLLRLRCPSIVPPDELEIGFLQLIGCDGKRIVRLSKLGIDGEVFLDHVRPSGHCEGEYRIPGCGLNALLANQSAPVARESCADCCLFSWWDTKRWCAG